MAIICLTQDRFRSITYHITIQTWNGSGTFQKSASLNLITTTNQFVIDRKSKILLDIMLQENNPLRVVAAIFFCVSPHHTRVGYFPVKNMWVFYSLFKHSVLQSWCTDHIKEASRMFVLLASGSTGASAMMTPERTAPPKQYNIALNQHAKGLRRDTSSAPVTIKK